MDFSDFLVNVLFDLAGMAPSLLFWAAAIVFGSIGLRRGGGRAERFLVAGTAIGVLAALLRVPVAILPLWMINSGHNSEEAISIVSDTNIAISIISAAGFACLIYAFWLKFHEQKPATIELERGPHDAIPA